MIKTRLILCEGRLDLHLELKPPSCGSERAEVLGVLTERMPLSAFHLVPLENSDSSEHHLAECDSVEISRHVISSGLPSAKSTLSQIHQRWHRYCSSLSNQSGQLVSSVRESDRALAVSCCQQKIGDTASSEKDKACSIVVSSTILLRFLGDESHNFSAAGLASWCREAGLAALREVCA